jgi:cytochrome P450
MYTPVLHVTRRIVRPTTIRDKARAGEIHVPTDMIIYVSPFLIHVDPNIWPDPLAFRPSRWLDENDQLVRPPKGHFLAWSTGPRICPGMKMAQVEFVSILRAIVSEWTIEPAGNEGESLGSATQRLRKMIDESQPKMTLQVKDPEQVNLRFQSRVEIPN